jgi:hypothetical protein
VASGVLNMTRGLGTALGLALAALVFGAAAGQTSLAPASNGFEAAALFLALVALLAALLSATRDPSLSISDRASQPAVPREPTKSKAVPTKRRWTTYPIT